MKKYIIALVMLSASLFFLGQDKTYPEVDPLAEQVTKFKNSLELDDAQTAKIRDILVKDRDRAAKDRETFKTNALDLIRAAQNRRKNTNTEIEALLNPNQKEEFKEASKMNRFDREFFELNEGLLLNDDQAFTVEGILIEYFNKMKEMMPSGSWSGSEMANEGRRGGRSMGRAGYGRLGGMMKSAERKKNKKIKRVLTGGQKSLFKQILEDRALKRKEMKKKMKERRKDFDAFG